MSNRTAEDEVAEKWRAGCECNRAGLCYRCQAATEIGRLREALQPFASAANGAEPIVRPMTSAGYNYSEACSAFIWQASRRVCVDDWRNAKKIMERT